MSISNNYLASSNKENEPAFNVTVKVKSDRSVTNKEVQACVLSILSNNEQVKSISIDIQNGKTVFTINNEGVAKTLELEPPRPLAASKINLKMVSISAEALKDHTSSDPFVKKTQSLKEVYRSLCNKKTSTLNKPVKFLASMVLAPVALVSFLLSPKIKTTTNVSKAATTANMPLALSGQQASQGKQELVQLLHAHQQIFNIPEKVDPNVEKYGSDFGISKQMNEALYLAKQPLKDRAQRSEAAKKSAKDILTRLNSANAKNAGPVNLAMIPAGYWKNGVYQPGFLAFSRNDQGKLCLSEISFGEKDGMFARDFQWDVEPTEENIAKLLDSILEQANADKPIQANPNQSLAEKAAILSEVGKSTEAPDQEASKTSSQRKAVREKGIEEVRENLVAIAGATPLADKEERREHVRGDPWKVLHEAVRTQYPEVPWADKTVFVVGVMKYKLEQVIREWDGLSKTEKKEWAQKLNNDYQHLVRHMESEGLTESHLTYEGGLELDLFKNIKEGIEILNAKAGVISGRDDEIQVREKVLDRVKTAPSSLKVETTKAEIIAENLKEKSSALTNDDIQAAYNLGQLVTDPNLQANQVEKINVGFASLAARIEELVASKHYDEAKELYKMAVRNLPPPGKEAPLWKAMNEAGKENPEVLEKFSLALSSMTKGFWESKLKTWDVPLKTSEWIDMTNVEMGLQQLIELRRGYVLDKLAQGGFNIDETPKGPSGEFVMSTDLINNLKDHGLTFDEICLLGKAGTLDKDYGDYIVVHFMRMNNLKPGHDVSLDQKISAISNYIKGRYPDIPTIQYIHNEKIRDIGTLVSREAQNIWNVMNGPSTTVFETLQFTIPTDLTIPHLPKQYVDFSRHQAMVVGLVHNGTAFYEENISGFSEEMERTGLGKRNDQTIISRYNSSFFSNPRNHTSDRLLSYKKAISKMDRLDLVTYNQPMKNGANVFLGVGEAQGEKPKLLLSRSPSFNLRYEQNGVSTGYSGSLEANYYNDVLLEELGVHKNPIEDHLNAHIYAAVRYGDRDTTSQLAEGEVMVSIPEHKHVLDAIDLAYSEENTEKFSAQELIDLGNLEIKGIGNVKSVTSTLNAMLYIIENPAKINHPIVRARLIAIFGEQGQIQQLIKERPEVVQKLGVLLSKIATESASKREISRLLFVVQIGTLLQNNLLRVQNPSALQQQLITDLPSYSKNYKINEKEYAGWDLALIYGNDSRNPEDKKMDALAGVLSAFSGLPGSNRPLESEPFKSNPNLVLRLMLAGNVLNANGKFASVPSLAESGARWAREVLAPAVFSESTDGIFRDKVLNAWIKTQEDESEPVTWKKGSGDQSNLWIGENHIIDPRELKIVAINGKQPKGDLPSLPSSVLENPQYKALFGDQVYRAKVLEGKTSEETIFEFKDRNGVEHRITEDKANGSITIDRKVAGELIGKDSNEWYRLNVSKDPSNLKGIERRIALSGMWVNLNNPEEGFSAFKHLDSAKPADIYKLVFSNGKVTNIYSSSGSRVVIDPKMKMEKVFAPIDTDRIVYMTTVGAYTVNEIRLLDQNITLKRTGEGKPWKVAEGNFEGYEVSFEGHDSAASKQLLGFMGASVEQVGMVLIHPTTKDQKILLWPNRVTSVNPEKVPPGEVLEFDKSQSNTAPMVLSYGADGRWHGAPDALMYISYLAAAKHEYGHALNLMEQVRREAGGNPKLLDHVMHCFLNMPGVSRRNIAIRLKAVLQIQVMLRQQNIGVQKPLSGKESEARLNDLAKISELVNKYNAFQNVREKSNGEISLNEHESAELEALGREGFSQIRERFSPLELKPEDRVLQVDSPIFAKQAIKNPQLIAPLLIAGMQKPPGDVKKLLNNLQPSGDFILKNFFALSNAIIDENLKPIDLIPLFGKIAKTGNEEQDAVVNYARCCLLDLASRTGNPEAPLPKYDLDELFKAHDSIPKMGNLITMVKMIVGKFHNPQVEAQLKQVNDALNKSNDAPISISPLGAAEKPLFDIDRPAYKISIQKLKEAIQADPELFGQYTKEIAQIIEKSKPDTLVEPTKLLIEAKEAFNKKLNENIQDQNLHVDLNLEKAEVEIAQKIHALETKLKASAATPTDVTDRFEEIMLSASENIMEGFLTPSLSSQETIQHLSNAAKEYTALLNTAKDTLDVADKDELLQGLQAAQKQLTELHEGRTLIFKADIDQLNAFEKVLGARQESSEQEANIKKGYVISLACEKKALLPENLARKVSAFEKGSITGDELFETLVNAYQRFQIVNAANASELGKFESTITEFLILKTEAQQLGAPAIRLLNGLKAIAEKQPLDTVTFNVLSYKLQTVIARGTNRERYMFGSKLINPQFSRKYLVTEYRSEPDKIILRPEQIELIEKAATNPSKFYGLRMGLGKTSIILPTLFQIWAEKGLLPIGILKDELLAKGYRELDPNTRAIIEQAGVLFSFDVITSSTQAGVLADQYLRLLEVKRDKGYVVSSIHTQASIEQKLVQMALERKALIKKLTQIPPEESLPTFDSPNYKDFQAKFAEKMKADSPEAHLLLNLQKEMYWLSKIKNLIDGDKDHLGFETQKFADEADDLYNVLKEDNLALGGVKSNKVPVDKTVKDMGLHLMEALFKSKDPNVVILKEALLNGGQTALKPEDIRNIYMPAFVRSLLSNPNSDVMKLIGSPEVLAGIPYEQLVNFICDRNADFPAGMPKWNPEAKVASAEEKFQKGIAALKGFVQNGLPKGLGLQPELDIGVKEKDGLTVGPRIRGAEEASMVYSDEFDIAANHIIQYAVKIPESSKFFARAIMDFRENKPALYESLSGRYNEYLTTHPDTTLLQFINLPQNGLDRIAIFKDSVLDKDLLSRYERQVPVPVQELASGNTGGMTGTPNEYVMPDTVGSKGLKEVPRIVEAEVALRIGMQKDKPVVVISESDNQILNDISPMIKDPNCKFIVSEGSALGGLNSYQAIAELRNKADLADLHFVFMFPKTPGDIRSNQAVVWRPGKDSEPVLISRADVAKGQRDYEGKMRFFFGAQNSRGTDFGPIEKGSGIIITGATTTTDSFGQAAYRERGLGEEHTISHMIVPRAQAQRIAEKQKVDINSIGWTNVVNDVRLQTLQQQKGMNLKTATEKVTSKLQIASRNITNALNPQQSNSKYWNASNPNRPTDILVEAAIHQAFEDVIVKTRDISFEMLYNSSKEVDLDVKMKDVFNKQAEKIKGKKEKVVKEVPPGERRDNAIKALDDTLKALADAELEFMTNLDMHKKKLPAKASISGSDAASSVAVVSEQQQQAESVAVAQAESVVVSSAESVENKRPMGIKPPSQAQRGGDYKGFEPDKFEDLESKNVEDANLHDSDSPFLLTPFRPNMQRDEKFNLKMIGCSEIFMTPQMKSIYNNLPNGSAPGKAIGFVAIIGDKAIIMSKADYAWIMEKEMKLNREMKDNPQGGVSSKFNTAYGHQPMGVISTMNFYFTGAPFVPVDQGAIAPNYNDNKVKLAIVKTKWIMGIEEYDRDERTLLRQWLLTYDDAPGYPGVKDPKKTEAMKAFISTRGNDGLKQAYIAYRADHGF